ncbi:MAG: fused MFS/spermidine synthase [Alphaproteobacteria bacterium]|nr:fused MFS/spermidine synthase [Alphaproteobacteria bacterium]
MPSNRISAAPGHTVIRAGGKVSYWQGEYHQSAADSVGVSTADYIHAMHYFLMQAQVKEVLMIGCGGGTLATMLTRAGVAMTVVDLHRLSFTIARKYFHLPEAVSCHVADGIQWLKQRRHRFDAIVLDAFGKDGMPKAFMRAPFFRLAKARLKQRGGLFLMNVIVDDDDDPTPDRLVRLMRRHWSRVRLLDTDGWVDRNAVIVAGAVAKLGRPKVLMPPHPGGAKLARALDILDWRTIR